MVPLAVSMHHDRLERAPEILVLHGGKLLARGGVGFSA
jgi:hypothetical protein